MATTRVLFPSLPPELRHEVYAYLSDTSPTSVPSTTSLPLKLKAYSCKHTTVQICLVHHGSTSLLALSAYGFAEAHEYGSWLLTNALTLRIGVTFRGRANTFVQADWDKKMEAHLHKLAKAHPWLEKVARYGVRVKWAPIDGVLKSRKHRRVAGSIVRDMASKLTCLMDEKLRKRKGEVDLKVCLTHSLAVQTMLSGTRFGLAELLGMDDRGFKNWSVEVRKEVYVKPPRPEHGVLLVPVPTVRKEEDCLLVVEEGRARWVGEDGHLIVKKNRPDAEMAEVSFGGLKQDDAVVDHVVLSLIAECTGLR